MKVWLWIGSALVVLLAATLAMLNRASGSWIDGEQVRLGALNADPGTPPKGLFHQLMDHDQANGPLRASYRYERQGQQGEVLVITLDNQASQVTNYNLFLASRPSDIDRGKRYRLTARLSATEAVRDPLFLGLGFQLYKTNGNYLSDVSPAGGLFKAVLGEAQALQSDWVGGTAEEQSGEVPASLLPRLSLYNIPPGFKGELRLQAPAMVVLDDQPAATTAKAAATSSARAEGPAASADGMYIGHAFHRYPGPSEKAFGPLTVRYQFARSLANDLTYLNQWWTGEDEYDWKGIDRWANFHARAGQRRLLITFSGSPRWASQAPEQYAAMGQPGNAAPPLRRLLPAYQRMVKETVARYKGRILAVECWNEPNSRDFFSGTPTELADLCQAVYEGTKSAAPEVPVICPQADSPENMGFVYEARTSMGDSILKRCDVLGAHIYNRLGRDAKGDSYSAQHLEDSIQLMQRVGQRHGADSKPLAVTEFGVSSCVTRPTRQHPLTFGQMPSDEAGEALYQTLREFKAMGVWMVALYSFDHEDSDPQCRPGGFTRMMRTDGGRQRVDETVVKRLNDAVADFGRRDGINTR